MSTEMRKKDVNLWEILATVHQLQEIFHFLVVKTFRTSLLKFFELAGSWWYDEYHVRVIWLLLMIGTSRSPYSLCISIIHQHSFINCYLILCERVSWWCSEQSITWSWSKSIIVQDHIGFFPCDDSDEVSNREHSVSEIAYKLNQYNTNLCVLEALEDLLVDYIGYSISTIWVRAIV